MADYGNNINRSDYRYKRPVYYTNPLNEDRENVIIKMILNSSNFNFSIVENDLRDLRLAESELGTHVLRMWIAYLDITRPYASIYFKLPVLLANQTITLWAFFGNSSASLVNEPDKIGFLFYETFDNTPLSSSKWSGDLNNSVGTYGYNLDYGAGMFYAQLSLTTGIINTITNPLYGKTKWILEAGTYLNSNYIDGGWVDARGTQSRSHAFNFSGSENAFGLQYLATISSVTNPGISNDAILPRDNYSGPYTPWEVIWSTNYGPEPFSYQENVVMYDESQDCIYQYSYDRNTLPDMFNLIYRKVYGETKISNVSILGHINSTSYDGAGPTHISWFVLREFDVSDRVLVDCRDLYTLYQDRLIEQPLIDYNEYGDDLTNIIYKHESSFGGNSLLLSDDSINTTWTSDINATAESEISVTISFCEVTGLVNSSYTHYDSNHVKYFGASKLSDKNYDVWARDFWDCPTATNGWSAIKFNEVLLVNSFGIVALEEDLSCCPKNFIFFGSNYNPVTDFNKAVELYSGTFSNISTFQQFFFTNIVKFNYYILFVLDNYGGSHIKIKEWEMYYLPSESSKKRASQLRLLPPTDDLLYSFPNEISLQASVDNMVWDTLIPWTQTYSPFVQHYPIPYGFWQTYSFIDVTEKGYCSYKLLCRDNWGDSTGRISIKEWELRELAYESYTYRLLYGSSNIIKQIWASENCGIDTVDELIYATNDKINYVNNDYVYYENLPDEHNDLVVISGV